ncbi:hypothetical protein Tdes44962_MAKER01062 [Teratosphaeria destructans]|uniref:Uncharacterized protein n=1 Tax=Teratosphaeria destructans TaxID=418781 RepID=A0A9W7SIH1_9PEZI|nr:hypothetical protein Tdes44962_MAKER01062 [Teratosphaeria destructans]
MHPLQILPLLLAPTTVLALLQSPKVDPGVQSCRAEQTATESAYYTVEIGVAYDAARCKNVGSALVQNFERTGHDPFKVTCHPRHSHKQTEMLFRVKENSAYLINPLLKAYFPEINDQDFTIVTRILHVPDCANGATV